MDDEHPIMSDRMDDIREADGESAPFGGEDVMPLERQRRAHRFLTQETRYHVLQAILGHPKHLVTLDEFEYLVPKNRSTIRDHLDRLADKHLIAKYVYDGEDVGPNDPREFWGLTDYGVDLLNEYGYLRYVPVLRALQDTIYLTAKIERHRTAPRPELPGDVADAFAAPELAAEAETVIDEMRTAREAGERLFDAPPIDPEPDADTEADANRPIDELF